MLDHDAMSRRLWFRTVGGVGGALAAAGLSTPPGLSAEIAQVIQTPLPQPKQFLSARAFGAKGNGKTNDAGAIRAAAAAAGKAGGGAVVLEAGVYAIDAMIELPSGVSLIGANRLKSVVRATKQGITMIAARGGASHAGVSNLLVDGQGMALVGVHFEGASDCFVEGVTAKDFMEGGSCFYMSRGASRNTWSNLVGHNGPASSMIIYNNAQLNLPNNDNCIINCVGRNSRGNMGLEIRRSHRNKVIGGRYHGNAQAGINIEEGAMENVVLGAQCDSNQIGLNFNGDPIAVCERNIFEGCIFANNDGPGIFALHASDNLFSGCDLYGNSIGADLRYEDPASNANRFSNCSIRNNRTHGLYFNGSYGSIVGGQVRGNTGSGILIAEAHDVVVSAVDVRDNKGGDIVETGKADYNVVMGCRAKDVVIVGKNSRFIGNPGIKDA